MVDFEEGRRFLEADKALLEVLQISLKIKKSLCQKLT